MCTESTSSRASRHPAVRQALTNKRPTWVALPNKGHAGDPCRKCNSQGRDKRRQRDCVVTDAPPAPRNSSAESDCCAPESARSEGLVLVRDPERWSEIADRSENHARNRYAARHARFGLRVSGPAVLP